MEPVKLKDLISSVHSTIVCLVFVSRILHRFTQPFIALLFNFNPASLRWADCISSALWFFAEFSLKVRVLIIWNQRSSCLESSKRLVGSRKGIFKAVSMKPARPSLDLYFEVPILCGEKQTGRQTYTYNCVLPYNTHLCVRLSVRSVCFPPHRTSKALRFMAHIGSWES